MRLDKFLKITRILKRRSSANEASSQGRVVLNGKVAKPASRVKIGDILEIHFGDRLVKYRILSIAEHVSKEKATELYEILEN